MAPGHGTTSELRKKQQFDESTHPQMLFQSEALWAHIKGSGNVKVCVS